MKQKTRLEHLLAGAAALALLGGGAARAQSVTVKLGAGVGTGLEIGRGAETTARRSPLFVVVNGGLLLDNDQRFEVGAALLMELEGRVGVALEPQGRLNLPPGRRLSGFAILGVPLFLSPYTLYGVAVGAGLGVRLWRQLSGFFEACLRYYPFGSDLPADGNLFHLDGALGVRHAF